MSFYQQNQQKVRNVFLAKSQKCRFICTNQNYIIHIFCDQRFKLVERYSELTAFGLKTIKKKKTETEVQVGLVNRKTLSCSDENHQKWPRGKTWFSCKAEAKTLHKSKDCD